MDDRTIPTLALIAKNALIAGHAPGDVFALIGELFNLVAPAPASAAPAAASSNTLSSRLSAAAPTTTAISPSPFIGATPAG